MNRQTGVAKKREKKRVIIAAEEAIVREGLADIVRAEDDLSVAALVREGDELRGRAAEMIPDLVIMDFEPARKKGLFCIKGLVEEKYAKHVLVFSKQNEMLIAERVLRAGASGYLQQTAPVNAIMPAIRKVLEGETYLSSRVRESLIGRVAHEGHAYQESYWNDLSAREFEVLIMMTEGYGMHEIGGALGIQLKTVEMYRSNLVQKMHVSDRNELQVRALEWRRWVLEG